MPDPFSISTGAVGIVSLGIQSLSITLEGLESSLKRHRSGPGQAHLVNNIESHIHACEDAIEDLDRELSNITRRGRQSGLAESVRKATQTAIYPFKTGTLLKLQEAVQDVRDNLSLALDILQLDTIKEIDERVADSSAVLALLKSDTVQQNVRTWLNAPNSFGQHYEACEKRHKDTGLWFIHSRQFQNWLQTGQSFLWLNGIAGSGKTVLTSTIIQETFVYRASSSKIGLAYFYLSYADSATQSVAGILSSLLLQLSCQSNPDTMSELYSTYLAGSPPDYALVLALRSVMKNFQRVYIIIDALDESAQGVQREALCRVINQMRQWNILSLLVTSRDYFDIREMLDVPAECDVSTQNMAVVADIRKYIREYLREGSALKKWKTWYGEIEDALCKGAGGMFRWVECQFLALKSCLTLNMLRDTLRSLPRSLDDTYDRMLASIKPEFLDFARRTLTLLCFSARPIQVTELIEALAVIVDEDDGRYDAGEKLSSAEDLLRICPGMIRITSPASTQYDPPSSERGRGFYDVDVSRRVTRVDRRIISLAHFSVREYLVSDYVIESSPLFHLRAPECHTWITRLCLVYLALPDMQLPGQYSYRSSFIWHYGTFDFLRYALECWSEHARKSSSPISLVPFIQKFRESPALNVALLRITEDSAESSKLRSKSDVPLDEALIVVLKWLSFEGVGLLVDAVLEAPEDFFPGENVKEEHHSTL